MNARSHRLPGWVRRQWPWLAAAATLGLFYVPRAVPPLRPPALQLPRDAVQAQLAKDRALAQKRPHSASASALEQLFLASGRAELIALEESAKIVERRQRVQAALREAKQQGGAEVVAIMRAVAVEQLEAVLAGRAAKADEEARLGTFPNLLAYHHVTLDSAPTAAHFVVRTLYKARWNTLHGLDHPDGFSPVEGQAYFGWLALHAARLPVTERLAALPDYVAAGGQRGEEAAGVLLFLSGQHAKSVAALTRAHRAHPSLRLRNYVLGAQAMAQGQL